MKVETNAQIPMTLLTGFLGAGKTTLLNNILHGDHGLRVAVLVNDFGSINIDTQLIVGVEGETITLSNGCICCTIRNDLLEAVTRLLMREERPEYIIIEASGVSDPAQIILTFTRSNIRNHVEIDSILTVIDAEQFDAIMDSKQRQLAHDQLRAADIVILNKMDLICKEEHDAMMQQIEAIVPDARILTATYGDVPLAAILGVGKYSPQRAYTMSPHKTHVHAADEIANHDHHDQSLVFSSWVWTCDQPLALQAVYALVETLPENIWRAKGILYIHEIPDRRGILQVVGRRVSVVQGEPWGDEQPSSQVVMLGTEGSINADQMRASWESTIASDDTPPLADKLSDVLRWLKIRK